CGDGAGGDGLLLRVLPHHHAASRTDRDAAPPAQLDHRGRAREEQGIGGRPARRRARSAGHQGLRHSRQTRTLTMQTSLKGLAALGIGCGLARAAIAQEEQAARATPHYPLIKPVEQDWSFAGPFGTYDRGQLQRGLKVYREVCSSCHGLERVAFRTLEGL